MKLMDLYKNIQKKNLINNVYSKYWIYDLEDSIVQNETGKYRKLRVKFFDRSPEISDELTNLTLTINGSNITMKNIISDGSCQNVKLMYCELQLDVDFVVNNIYISKYTLNQQEEQLSSQYYIKGIIYKGDEGRLNICKDLLGESNFVIAPEYNNMFWYCGCGYANMHNQHSCVRCNQSKEKMTKIADTNKEKLVFDNIKNSFNIDYKVPVETKLEQYVQDIANKYGVSKDLIMAQFNITELKRKQQELVDKTIVDYLNTNTIHFNYEKTFEENMDEYLSGIVKGIIYKNDVKQHLHMEQLANKYANGKKQYDDEKKKEANKKKIILVIGGIATIAIVLLASIGLIKPQENAKNNSDSGIKIENTKENINNNEDGTFDEQEVIGLEPYVEEEVIEEEPIVEEEIIVEEKVEYIKGEEYPTGEYVLRVNNVFVRSGPDNKSYDVLKTDSLVGDTKNDNQAMLAKGTILDIEEIQHTSSGYWGKIKNHDDAWICLYYEGSYKGDREFAGYLE